MSDGELSRDEAAVSEMASVLTLVVIAFVIVLAIGANVLFFEPQSDHPEAAFSFDYFDESSQLLVTHVGGDQIRAGDLLIRGPDAQATWAEIDRNANASTIVGQADAISVSRSTAYGVRVRPSDRIAVVYSNVSTNSTAVLAQWNGTRG
jgi:hypothetical protein